MRWFSFKLIRRLSYFVILLLIIICSGMIGYIGLENYDIVDAFYMTIITISTVGFGEVQDLSPEGKIFTATLIISSFGTFAYAISSITTYMVGGEYKEFRKQQNLMIDIQKLKNHVIICGFGRVGKQVAEDLAITETPFVVIENDSNLIEDHKDQVGYIFLKGDATSEESLVKANLAGAKSVISCLPKDTDNLYVVLSARERNSRVIIISRATSSGAISKLKFAGANNVILPDTIGGSHMASLITNPDVMEFLDIVRVQGTEGANINSVSFAELPSDLQNKTIGQLDAKKITGVSIIGYKTPDGSYIVNPDSEIIMVPHSSLFVLGSGEQINKLRTIFGLKH
jgi:voltage-gated potassium channel|tara:strand:- start:2864 stop:3889 length:1026 start_codon:yes stop_codon:yes gene_type:complete